MLRKSALALLASSLALTACQTDMWGNDQAPAAPMPVSAPASAAPAHVRPAPVPAPVVAPPAVSGAGVVLGGWISGDIGSAMDDGDKQKNQQAEKRAYTAPIGQRITWNNPDTGNAGTIVAVKDGYDNNGAYCRDFQQSVTIGGKQAQGHGKACQLPDGSWKTAQ